MTHTFKKIFTSFLERPDVWFFYGFLATFTLSIRKVLFFYPIKDVFNEYTGIYLYLSDIFLFLTIATWLFILCNKYHYLSIFKLFTSKCSTWNIFRKNYIQNVPRLPRSNKMFHVEHFVYFWGGTFICLKKVYKQVINNYLVIFPLFLAFFSFLSIIWAVNKPIALFRSIKLFEFILLYLYIIYNVPRLPNILKMFHVEHFKNLQDRTLYAKNTNIAVNAKYSTPVSCSKNVPRGTFLEEVEDKKCSTWNIFGGLLMIIILSGFIQSIIGFLQFFINKSIGLFWLKESVLSPETSGVAKIITDGIVHIRSYGLFPHPNIFGGFLVFSIVSTLIYFKMFHACPVVTNCSTWNNLFTSGVEHFEKKPQTMCSALAPHNVPPQYKCSTWNIVRGKRGTFVMKSNILWNKYGKLFLFVLALFQVSALLLTFSKSAIIGLFIGFLYIFKTTDMQNVPRGTFSKVPMFKMFHVEHFWKKIILLLLSSVLLFFIIKPDIRSLFLKSLDERSIYLNVSRGTFLENPFFGIGTGQFVPNLENVTNLEMWQFQPVHNVFLLILNDYGIFILFLFVYFLFKMFHVEHYTGQAWNIIRGRRGTFSDLSSRHLLKAILLAFIFIMFFDHYLWDIQQGQAMLWTILGLIIVSHKK